MINEKQNKIGRRNLLKAIATAGLVPAFGCAPTVFAPPKAKAGIRQTDEFSFAVVGDIHYKKPLYEVSEYFVRPFANEINERYPEVRFIAQIGDFVHGGRGKSEDEMNFGLKDFADKIKRPFYIAKGNHDQFERYDEITKRLFSSELEKDIPTVYYSFDCHNSHFIFLNCMDRNPESQFHWLANDLKKAKSSKNTRHIFVFNHYPLWIVARAGFTDKAYAKGLISIFSEFEIDAFFCGHTHNQTVSVRSFKNKKITQMMNCSVVEQGRLKILVPYVQLRNGRKTEFLALEKVRRILIPEETLHYFWGYIEGGPSGYFIVNVDDSKVNVKFCSPGKGVIREFCWEKPGKIVDIIKPEQPEQELPSQEDLAQITTANLYYSYWSRKDAATEVTAFLNGAEIGNLRVNFPHSPWWNQYGVEIDPKFLPIIKAENELIIKNPARNVFGVVNCLLQVSTKGGKKFSSFISEHAYLSCKDDSIDPGNLPDLEILKTVDLGENLGPIRLRFHLKKLPKNSNKEVNF